ncbi:thioredoxin family protein [Desulfomonile tiedjei]|uniref:Thioredoxin domain-containing protein n=1 Tax=Desulfomonile tiedjei (strain ATCC 49306 / DSM 6799 / DCB-1) TaxID=706587 RepID=I4C5J2_DESTA|nr:thioredoxin domain-containing protein [Desulfomonile tiedjei]AFM24833.1 thioredoxin domain-containing protein [Desulfomonile tiedjei DSM 6799]
MFTAIQDMDFRSTVQSLETGVIIFVKKLCPHCKNMLKVLEKFQAIIPGVPVFTVDSEECPNSMDLAGVERVPTVCVVKKGEISAQKNGLMNPREMAAFYEAA